MLCSKCHKNEATIFYKQNINGEIKEYALCPQCAASVDLKFPSVNLFGSMFQPKNTLINKRRCTLCNSTLDEIRANGKAGCSECYSVFSDELMPMIGNIHSTLQHTGRAPEGYAEKRKEENMLNDLRLKLKDAVAREDYETSAELRDRRKELEGGDDNEG